jgi:hypothetical protein
MNKYPGEEEISANQIIPKQAMEIIMYSWNKDYCI